MLKERRKFWAANNLPTVKFMVRPKQNCKNYCQATVQLRFCCSRCKEAVASLRRSGHSIFLVKNRRIFSVPFLFIWSYRLVILLGSPFYLIRAFMILLKVVCLPSSFLEGVMSPETQVWTCPNTMLCIIAWHNWANTGFSPGPQRHSQ